MSDGVEITRLTPPGAGGVAVLAVTGDGRAALLSRLLGDRNGPRADLAVDSTPRVRWLWLDGDPVDQVVVLEPPGAGHFELHLHASEAVLGRFEAALGTAAAMLPRPALLDAGSVAQLAFALEQARLLAPYGGAFAGWLAAHAHDRAALDAAHRRGVAALAMSVPAPLVLCGRTNAGKSTLMNRLVFHERVLTGPEPGLTRDPVGEVTVLAGYPYEVVDTAGEGDDQGELDARAVALGRALRAGAWRLVVVDGSRPAGEVERRLAAEGARCVLVASKADLPAVGWDPALPPPDARVSALDPQQAARVRAQIGEVLRRRRGLAEAGPLGGVAPSTRSELEALRSMLPPR